MLQQVARVLIDAVGSRAGQLVLAIPPDSTPKDSLALQRLEPREDVLLDAVHQRAVEVQDERGCVGHRGSLHRRVAAIHGV